MLFPTSVLCNEAGQGVLRQKVRTAINALNRDWNYCSYSLEGKLIYIIYIVTLFLDSYLLDGSDSIIIKTLILSFQVFLFLSIRKANSILLLLDYCKLIL